jgi:signal transduction histidine kinase
MILNKVRALVQASKRLAAGAMDTRLGLQRGTDELSQLAGTFDEMAAAIEQREAKLTASREELRSLSSHLEEVREEERTRLARRIHDDLGQALTIMKIDISWVRNQLDPKEYAVAEKLESLLWQTDETIHKIHKVCQDLRPAMLDDFGLAAAVEYEAEEFQKRTGIACTVDCALDEVHLDKKKTVVFRILQEALTNVIRHASASKVDVRAHIESSRLIFEIQDNGKGIPKSAISAPNSFGLIGIRERAHTLGGDVSITGSPGAGTLLRVVLPLSEELPES